jgi:zinc transporter ZupT
MTGVFDLVTVALLGLATTSSSLVGAALGLYTRLPRLVLAAVLAFAAGALISALAIELAYDGAQQLHQHGFGAQSAWAFVGGGFALGALIYYGAAVYLEKRGAAIRLPTRFQEYAVGRKQHEVKDLITLLSKCDLLRHLPPDEIEDILEGAACPLEFIRGQLHLRSGFVGRRGGGAHTSVEPGTDNARPLTVMCVEGLRPSDDRQVRSMLAKCGLSVETGTAGDYGLAIFAWRECARYKPKLL